MKSRRGAAVGGGAIRVGRGAEPTLAWPGVVGAGFALSRDADRRSAFQAVPALFRGRRCAFRGPLGKGRRTAERGKKQMAANRRFAADHFGGKCGGYPLSQKQQRPIGTRRRAPPAARKGVSIPEPGAAGSRVPRPQPLLLRGLRAAPAALRKSGAKRRAVRKGGSPPNTPTTNNPPESGAPLPDRST